MTDIQTALFALRDPAYQAFQSKLIPTIDPQTVIGVRMPALRKLAREIAGTPVAEGFLQEPPHRYYEKNNLHGLLISAIPDYDGAVAALETFLPYVDNWATCDLLSPKAFRKHPPELRKQIRRWVEDAHTYTVRFGLGMLMSFYLDEGFQMEDLDLAAGVRREEYYVKMMAAWYFATALAKQYDAALPYLRQRRPGPLDPQQDHSEGCGELSDHAGAEGRASQPALEGLRKGGGGMKGRSCGLFLCLFLGIACFSGYQVLRILHEYRVGADAYFKLEQFASLPPASEETEETPAEPAWPEVDFTALAAVNPDVTAWLYGPDTGISYPVVQGTDNDYYLDHLLDGTANSAGCLFVDTSCRLDFSGRNTVIYGHRMKNGTMFAALGNYQEQVYYDAHPVFLLVTPEGRYVVELFSGYVADTAESAWMLDFSDEQAYLAWLEEVGEKSAFSSKVSPRAEDRVVTLSTCSYEFENARFVLHGVLRPEEE